MDTAVASQLHLQSGTPRGTTGGVAIFVRCGKGARLIQADVGNDGQAYSCSLSMRTWLEHNCPLVAHQPMTASPCLMNGLLSVELPSPCCFVGILTKNKNLSVQIDGRLWPQEEHVTLSGVLTLHSCLPDGVAGGASVGRGPNTLTCSQTLIL